MHDKERIYKEISCICTTSIIYIIIGIIIGAFLLCICCHLLNSGQKNTLYTTQSVADQGAGTDLSVDIPANSAITKIYMSIRQSINSTIDGGTIFMSVNGGDLLFRHRFSKDPQASIGEFITTLEKPLCVGPEGASLLLNPLNGNSIVPAENMTITVLYIPNFCMQQ